MFAKVFLDSAPYGAERNVARLRRAKRISVQASGCADAGSLAERIQPTFGKHPRCACNFEWRHLPRRLPTPAWTRWSSTTGSRGAWTWPPRSILAIDATRAGNEPFRPRPAHEGAPGRRAIQGELKARPWEVYLRGEKVSGRNCRKRQASLACALLKPFEANRQDGPRPLIRG